MRELKFRAWDNRQNKYLNRGDISIDGDGLLTVFGTEGKYSRIVQSPGDLSPQFVIEQETGAINVAKNKIYEGDIAKYRTADYQREVFEWRYGVVVFKNCGFELYDPIKDTTESLTDISINFSKIEVVGNIHENPELLEEK